MAGTVIPLFSMVLQQPVNYIVLVLEYGVSYLKAVQVQQNGKVEIFVWMQTN
jgi:hypothetical protein